MSKVVRADIEVIDQLEKLAYLLIRARSTSENLVLLFAGALANFLQGESKVGIVKFYSMLIRFGSLLAMCWQLKDCTLELAGRAAAKQGMMRAIPSIRGCLQERDKKFYLERITRSLTLV